jgi:hypothetical protein
VVGLVAPAAVRCTVVLVAGPGEPIAGVEVAAGVPAGAVARRSSAVVPVVVVGPVVGPVVGAVVVVRGGASEVSGRRCTAVGSPERDPAGEVDAADEVDVAEGPDVTDRPDAADPLGVDVPDEVDVDGEFDVLDGAEDDPDRDTVDGDVAAGGVVVRCVVDVEELVGDAPVALGAARSGAGRDESLGDAERLEGDVVGVPTARCTVVLGKDAGDAAAAPDVEVEVADGEVGRPSVVLPDAAGEAGVVVVRGGAAEVRGRR